MIIGMTDGQAQAFIEKFGATTIASDAVLKCIVLGLPVDIDNVILCVGDFLDPTDPHFTGLIDQIEKAIVDMVEDKMPVAIP